MNERLRPNPNNESLFSGEGIQAENLNEQSEGYTPKEWENAKAELTSYKGGIVRPENGPSYRYPAGRRLAIDNVPVMDTCEGPWGQKTVDAAFDHPSIQKLERSKTLKVLERGAGLNIAGTRIIDRLKGRGSGEYHVIELNNDIADMAEEWKAGIEADLEEISRNQGIRYNIKIFIHRGEAREVTKDLVDKGDKFNIIISDTYPLNEKERGTNDITDVGTIQKGLYRDNGVFAFFSYFPGMETEGKDSHVTTKQLEMVRPYFENMQVSDAETKPPEDYTYLFDSKGEPIRQLPVVICSGKRRSAQS